MSDYYLKKDKYPLGEVDDEERAKNPDYAAWLDAQNCLQPLWIEGKISIDERNGISSLISAWISEKNPSLMDTVFLFFEEKELQMPNVIQNQFTSAVKYRRSNPKVNRTTKYLNRMRKNKALLYMGHLIAAGLNVQLASEKSATLVEHEFPHLTPIKASVLSKEYPKNIKNKKGIKTKTIQMELQDLHDNNPELAAKWKEIIKKMPETKKALIGERR